MDYLDTEALPFHSHYHSSLCAVSSAFMQVDDHDYDGRCALHVAASEGQLQVSGVLLPLMAADCH